MLEGFSRYFDYIDFIEALFLNPGGFSLHAVPRLASTGKCLFFTNVFVIHNFCHSYMEYGGDF